jgi:hypothetical protein
MVALEGLMLRLGTAGCALLALVGCSPVKDTSNVPDAPIDSTDMRPPGIESSSPPMNGTKVSILQPITVFMDEALDPDTVNATTVKLGYDAHLPILVLPAFDQTVPNGAVPAGLQYLKGTVSYDEIAKKVSFVPAAPLPYGYVFTLEMQVKDKAGIEFKGGINFTTYVNGETKQFFFNGSNGNPSSWVGKPTDMNGRQTKRLSGSVPGPDTIWFTSDDPKDGRYDYKFDPDGRILEERYYLRGTDNLFDTADDVINVCVTYKWNAQHVLNERTYTGTPGPDNMLCTPDDVPATNTIYNYMDGKLQSVVYYTAPGTDNTWRTPDDRCSYYYDNEYDAKGNKTKEILRNCAGDGVPHSADDTYYYYLTFEYDAAGYVTKRTQYAGAGTDGMWLTADDVIGNFIGLPPLVRFNRDADGQVTEQLISNGAGTDTMWGTADDQGSRTTTMYNAKKLASEITTYIGVGADGMWGTADDVIGSYQKLTYDEYGNRTDAKLYTQGADGQWKTPDDRINNDSDYDLAH